MTARHMTCCVCGADAGHWQQHWNRDTGYGICAPCAATQAGREKPEEMTRLYGQPGVNFEAPTYLLYGRRFAVDGPEIILAGMDDKGVMASLPA